MTGLVALCLTESGSMIGILLRNRCIRAGAPPRNRGALVRFIYSSIDLAEQPPPPPLSHSITEELFIFEMQLRYHHHHPPTEYADDGGRGVRW